MSAQDYKINAEVRRFLVSRWVDVARLQIGATNSVVYIMGFLDTTVSDPQRRADRAERRADGARHLRLVLQLDKDLRRMPGVRDVVFKLDNVYKRGGKWRMFERAREEDGGDSQRQPYLGSLRHTPDAESGVSS